MQRPLSVRRVFATVTVCAALIGGLAANLAGLCGPFTDVAADSFCQFVLEILTLGITSGTSATTYDPGGNVTRLQMAKFLSLTVDGALKRSSRRAALNQFWTLKRTETDFPLGPFFGFSMGLPSADGMDIWVPAANLVGRFRASDGRLLETWTSATGATAAIAAEGHVFITGSTSPGVLYALHALFPPAPVTAVATNLGNSPYGLAFDGAAVWTANTGGSVSMATVGATAP